MTDIEKRFIIDHIEEINSGITLFFQNHSNINKEDALSFLSSRLHSALRSDETREILYQQLVINDFKKNKIKDIANQHGYYESDLKNFFRQYVLQKNFLLYQNFTDDLVTAVTNVLIDKSVDRKQYKFVESDYKKIIPKALYVSLKNGFTENLTNVNFGVMVANAGDASEFLFVARAILAGYNCSSVDVRSSRYDAIIDFKGTLLRVQIKGINSNQVHFKDRDRGGQGIDHTHERNIGKRITSQDCDIYVAVDKQIGIVYIIPMYEVDLFSDEELTKNTSELEHYKENWELIHDVVERRRITN